MKPEVWIFLEYGLNYILSDSNFSIFVIFLLFFIFGTTARDTINLDQGLTPESLQGTL